MNYAILRTAKLKKGDVGAMAHHHDRTRTTLNADPDLKHENILLAGVASAEVPNIINQRITNIEAINGKKTRKDAVAGIEVLMTASPEWFADKHEWQIKHWAKGSVDWANTHFGKDNVISAVLHRDETTPHIHLVVFPETPDHKLCAKHWLDGVDKMQAMQDSYAEKVQDNGLNRGIKGSKAKHMDIKRWYAVGLPLARQQVKAMTDRALEIGANIEKTLEKQFKDFAQQFIREKVPQQERQQEREHGLSQQLQHTGWDLIQTRAKAKEKEEELTEKEKTQDIGLSL